MKEGRKMKKGKKERRISKNQGRRERRKKGR